MNFLLKFRSKNLNEKVFKRDWTKLELINQNNPKIMYKFLLSAFAATSVSALRIADTHEDDFSTAIDESASTKLVGIVGW